MPLKECLMVRSLKWLASIAVGLSLAWHCAPLTAQSFAGDDEPAPLETEQEAGEDEATGIAGDQEAEADEMLAEEGDTSPLTGSRDSASDEMPNDAVEGDESSAHYDHAHDHRDDTAADEPMQETADD